MITSEDKKIVQGLAKQYLEIANDDKIKERIQRIRKTNSLEHVRPIVWMDELPWHELNADGSLDIQCTGEIAKEMELFFKRTLFRWKHFQADMVVDNWYNIHKSFSFSDIGVNALETTIIKDKANNIISHSYIDVLDTDEKLDALKSPIVTVDPQLDQSRIETAEELLDGLIPVKLRGHSIYHAPWDLISRFRGVEAIFIDIMERPEFIHKTIRIFTDFYYSQWKQMESQGLFDSQVLTIHCTPALCNDLPDCNEKEGSKMKDVWFRGMAQLFGAVSKQVHEEFDINYMKPIMEQCKIVYYGCCEPLDDRMDMLMKIPNMRKIGVTPWADVNKSAEQIGKNYVLSHKPNPANVAILSNEDVIKSEVTKTIEACMKHGCPCDIVLKDVSTVSYNVQNLITWNKVVQETLDKYYS